MKLPSTLALLLACGLAQAQTTVWRCGADGRSFSDSPCDGGRVVAVVADAPQPADRARARLLALQDQRLAGQLGQERREREARLRGNGLAGIRPAAAAPLTPAESPALKEQKPKKRSAAAGTSRKAARTSRRTPG